MMSSSEEANGFSGIGNEEISQDGASSSRSELEIDKYGFLGGKEYTDPNSETISVEKVRRREMKWLQMLDNWDKWMAKRFIQVKHRCRKGIPSSLRGRAWQLLCGSKQLQAENKDVFSKLQTDEASTQVVEDIEKDLHRQFPFHEMFSQRGGTGQQDLRNVLYAYAIYNTRDGYCQAQAPIAAVLLMHMPAEEAFWCMVAMFEYYIPGYFSPGLEAVQVDGNVMQGLLKHVSTIAYKHLEKQHVSPMLYCTEWFMCIFSRTLPWPSVLRLWDMFFCEGVKIVFRCGLVLLKTALGKAEIVKGLPGMYETLECLKKFDIKSIEPEALMAQIIELKITEDDLKREHKHQLKEFRKQNSQAKLLNRTYRFIPTHMHRRNSGTTSTPQPKKRLNTVSVNTPHMMAQAVEFEEIKKRQQKLKASPSRYKKSPPAVELTDYRRYTDDSLMSLRTNGDFPGTSSLSASTEPSMSSQS